MLTLELGRLGPALIASVLALALARLWIGPGRELRRGVPLALWLAALVVLAGNAAMFVLNDDEVFYLVDSYAQRNGEASGYLPLRYLLPRPLAMLPVRPSLAVLAARAATVLLAAGSGLAAWRLAQALGVPSRMAAVAGAVAGSWLGTAVEMVFLRPEYLATALVIAAVVLLSAPPPRLSSRAAIAVAFALLALAGGVSPRQGLLVPLALAAVAWDHRREGVAAALGAACLGLAVGAAPSVAYVVAFDDPAALWYWNVAILAEYGPLSTQGSAKFPLPLFAAGVGGLVSMAFDGGAEPRPGRAVVGALWLGATVLPMFVPHWLAYAHGTWVVLSVVLGALLWARAAPRAPRPAWAAVLFTWAACVVAPLLHPAGLRLPRDGGLSSQLGLIDWLASRSRGGPVACVSPYHPIRARNAWTMWNAWWYCYRRDPARLRATPGRPVALPAPGEAVVIQWDAWPKQSGQPNVIAWAVSRGVLSPQEAGGTVQQLARHYRLVRWRQPLPGPYGGGAFLVHRTVAVEGDPRVEILDDDHILRAAP